MRITNPLKNPIFSSIIGSQNRMTKILTIWNNSHFVISSQFVNSYSTIQQKSINNLEIDLHIFAIFKKELINILLRQHK